MARMLWRDLLALRAEALVLLARGFHLLRNLLQAGSRLWGTAWTALLPARRGRCRGALAPA